MGSHCSWKQPLSVVSPAKLLPHQQLSASQLWCEMGQQSYAFHFAECIVDQGRGHTGRGASSWRDIRELIAWLFKFDIEQPSIVLQPCLHLVFVSELKLTSIFAYTVLTNNVLVCTVHLFGDMENTITIWDIVMKFSFSASDFANKRAVLPCISVNVGRQF